MPHGKSDFTYFFIGICAHEIFLSDFDFFAGILLTKLPVRVYTVVTKKDDAVALTASQTIIAKPSKDGDAKL